MLDLFDSLGLKFFLSGMFAEEPDQGRFSRILASLGDLFKYRLRHHSKSVTSIAVCVLI